MNTISAMPSSVAKWLSERQELSDMVFLTEYPATKKAVPLKKTTVAVGIKAIEIQDALQENDENDVLNENEHCRTAIVTLRFSIHAPYSLGGIACHEAFADIIDCLTFDSGLEITTSGCDAISEDRDTDAFVLKAHAEVKSVMCPAAETDLVFPSFSDKTLLCGTHIRDENIHLTEAQRTFLEQPYVSGRYLGTGTATRTVDVGFEPTEVVVTAGEYPPLVTGDGMNECYSATAVQSGGSMGVELTETGFRVFNGDSRAIAGCKPMMNETGLSYIYLCRR